jgi:hypothetical protein
MAQRRRRRVATDEDDRSVRGRLGGHGGALLRRIQSYLPPDQRSIVTGDMDPLEIGWRPTLRDRWGATMPQRINEYIGSFQNGRGGYDTALFRRDGSRRATILTENERSRHVWRIQSAGRAVHNARQRRRHRLNNQITMSMNRRQVPDAVQANIMSFIR